MKKHVPLVISFLVNAIIQSLSSAADSNLLWMIPMAFVANAAIAFGISLVIHGVRFLFSKSLDWDRVTKTAFIVSVVFIIMQLLHLGLEFMRHR